MKRVLLLIFAAMGSAVADPISIPMQKVGQKEYASASVEKDGETMAKVTHDAGVARVKILDLPKDVLLMMGIDAAAAKSLRERDSAEVAAQQQTAARAAAKARMLAASPMRKRFKKGGVEIIGELTVTETQPGGIVGRYGFKAANGSSPRFTMEEYGPGDIFVMTKTQGEKYVDGKTYPMEIILMGTHTFITVTGASRTIPKWKDVNLALDEEFPESVPPQSSAEKFP